MQGTEDIGEVAAGVFRVSRYHLPALKDRG
jgi:hypothetical protein